MLKVREAERQRVKKLERLRVGEAGNSGKYTYGGSKD